MKPFAYDTINISPPNWFQIEEKDLADFTSVPESKRKDGQWNIGH